jgi:hypothetical protein
VRGAPGLRCYRSGVRLFTCLLVLATGCGSSLKLTKIDSSVQRPSNVAVYFTVETGDGEPVAGLSPESFRIYEDGQLVSVHESKQTILNPEVVAAHYTLLLVDMSGSVTESGDVPVIVEAATAFAERVQKYQTVGVYAFDGSPRITQVSGFQSNQDGLARGVARLQGFQPRDPSTNLHGAVLQALQVLDQQLRRAQAPLKFGTLVVFTDGTDRAGRVPRDTLHKALDGSRHDVVVIGVGAEVNAEELQAIGRSETILTKNRDEIAQAFSAAAAHVEAQSRRFYLLGYCSPARAGTHAVRIEAEVNGRSGSLEYEFRADGFGPNCDPSKKPAFNLRNPRPVAAAEPR